MHYDIYPVEWSAQLRVKEAHRRAEHGRLVSLFRRLRRRPTPERQTSRRLDETPTRPLRVPSGGD
jgi:hypothetical protein